MKRLLYIAHRVPYPPDKGERVRAFHQIKALSQRFRITLAALAHEKSDFASSGPLEEICEKVILAHAGGKVGLVRGVWRMLKGGSVTEGYFHCPEMRRRLRIEAGREPFDVVLAYCSSMLPPALEVPAAGHVIDLVDVDSAKWFGYAASARWPKSWLYRREARAVRRLEQQALERCDAVMLVSQAETDALGDGAGKVTVIGNGVDTEYFAPRQRPPSAPSLVFTGTMDYRPNVEGVCWFVREVWGGLKRDLPELTFTIVGRNPTRAVRRLGKTPGVSVTGSVADVRGYLEAAGVAICPLLIARGVQNKILEAMSAGKPVVASPAAIEGLDVEIGTDLVQAETPDQWRQRILSLIGDSASCEELGRRARKCVEDKYSWSARMQPLVSLCERFSEGGTGL